MFFRRSRQSSQRGQILVIVAAGMLVFIGLVGLVIDTGVGFRERRHLQNVSDLSAMAGTKVVADHYLDGGRTGGEVYTAIDASLTANGCGAGCTWAAEYVRPNPAVTGSEIDLGPVNAVNPIPPNAQGVRVTSQSSPETFFIRVLGIDHVDVATAATAMTSSLLNLAPAGVLLPIAAFDSDYEAGVEYELTEGTTGPGNFGWLTWTGANNAPTLANSICTPDNPELTFPEWVEGAPGNMNSSSVRACLDQWLGSTVLIPIWGQTNGGGGSNHDYEIITLGAFVLTDYDRHASTVNGYFVEFYTLPGVPAGYGSPPCLPSDGTCSTRTNFIGLTR